MCQETTKRCSGKQTVALLVRLNVPTANCASLQETTDPPSLNVLPALIPLMTLSKEKVISELLNHLLRTCLVKCVEMGGWMDGEPSYWRN